MHPVLIDASQVAASVVAAVCVILTARRRNVSLSIAVVYNVSLALIRHVPVIPVNGEQFTGDPYFLLGAGIVFAALSVSSYQVGDKETGYVLAPISLWQLSAIFLLLRMSRAAELMYVIGGIGFVVAFLTASWFVRFVEERQKRVK